MEHISRVVISASGLSGPIIVEVVGCLTLESFSAASAVLDQLLAVRSFPDLIVDLRGTAHIEPVGLAALEMYFAGHRVPQGLPEISLATPRFPRPCVADESAAMRTRDPHWDSGSRSEPRSENTYERRPFLRWRSSKSAVLRSQEDLHPV
ncbi:hypothetical protein LSI54_00020 [Nesterenkonia sp. AY15]|uniref:hypothetical protein n=1 Tax=Nesterenkonia sp. AY15 TaxID=2901139 RepID=UPI001F4D09EE|nr:hypothetical protein [Nesterenkonia sp. AY15]MCH8569754.1 hypothetical protein [Nesterenkonia sp. AY15]